MTERLSGEYTCPKGPSANFGETGALAPASLDREGDMQMGFEATHLEVLGNIEVAIVGVYDSHPGMSDYDVMRALDAVIGWYRAEYRNHVQKPVALDEPESEIYERVRTACECCLGRGDPATVLSRTLESVTSLEDLLGCLRKIRKSVDYWNKQGGPQGYLTFVSQYV